MRLAEPVIERNRFAQVGLRLRRHSFLAVDNAAQNQHLGVQRALPVQIVRVAECGGEVAARDQLGHQAFARLEGILLHLAGRGAAATDARQGAQKGGGRESASFGHRHHSSFPLPSARIEETSMIDTTAGPIPSRSATAGSPLIDCAGSPSSRGRLTISRAAHSRSERRWGSSPSRMKSESGTEPARV